MVRLFATEKTVTVTPNEAHGIIEAGKGELQRVYEERLRQAHRSASKKKTPKTPRKYKTREMRPSGLHKDYKIK